MDSLTGYILGILLLMAAVATSMVLANRLEQERKNRFPHTMPYQWGYLWGCLGFWFAPATLGLSALFGWGIIKRRRWAWVVGTILTLNPFAWIINGIYAGRRWQEFGIEVSGVRGADQRYYDTVAEELRRSFLRPGLWTRAVAETGGEGDAARALYVRLRVAELTFEDERSGNPLESTPPIGRLTRAVAGILKWTAIVIPTGCAAGFALAILIAAMNKPTPPAVASQNTPSTTTAPASQTKSIGDFKAISSPAPSVGALPAQKPETELSADGSARFEAIKAEADQGNAKAERNLGWIYAHGQGVPKNYEAAYFWFSLAADQGITNAIQNRDNLVKSMTTNQIASAQYEIGVTYDYKWASYYGCNGVSVNKAQAAKWYRSAAENGNASAQIQLGGMYDHGDGVPQNYLEALSWYRQAAEQGDQWAQRCVALFYETGDGVPQDYAEAAKWWRKAADQGIADPQFTLGLYYERGQGVPQDFVEAYKWFSLAATHQGETAAAAHRDRLLAFMTPEQIAEAQKLAREFKPHEELSSRLSTSTAP